MNMITGNLLLLFIGVCVIMLIWLVCIPSEKPDDPQALRKLYEERLADMHQAFNEDMKRTNTAFEECRRQLNFYENALKPENIETLTHSVKTLEITYQQVICYRLLARTQSHQRAKDYLDEIKVLSVL